MPHVHTLNDLLTWANITFATLSCRFILLPSVTSYKRWTLMSTLQKLFLKYRRHWVQICGESSESLLNQVFSFTLLLQPFRTSLYLQVVWTCFFSPSCWPSVGIFSLPSCVEIYQMCARLSWSDIRKQANSAHIINWAILKSVICLLLSSHSPVSEASYSIWISQLNTHKWVV